MKRKRDYDDYLRDIVDAAEKLEAFVDDVSYSDFIENDEKQFAVIRALEIIGEAARYIPTSFRAKHDDIPWKEMVGMRDKLIHGYFGVSLTRVWETVENDIPTLANQVRQILIEIESDQNNEL
jgi:uncharacterized protein with HEPN domain